VGSEMCISDSPSAAGRRTDAYLGEVMPRHVDMAPSFDQMLTAFEAWDPSFDVNVGNFPYCLLPQWSHRIHHGGMETLTLAADLDNGLTEKDKYEAQHSDKLHGPRCRACAFERQCSGVFDAYARIHGTDELRPVTAATWAALDVSGGRFALVEGARSIAAAMGIGQEELRVEEPGLSFEDRGVRVTIAPRGRAGLAVARQGALDVAINATQNLGRPEAEAWIDDVRERSVFDAAPRTVWVAALMGAEHVARGRAAIANLIGRASLRVRHEPDDRWPGVRVVGANGVQRQVSISWPGAQELLEHGPVT
ncbi:MAG: hypothetical protein KUG77_03880, partial [Nannocystaceae bacterium]|nr:hypothetical protein [Nannocystaceae bacterium]